MTLSERRAGDVTILDLNGRLVLEDGEAALRERINSLVGEGRTKIVLNLRNLTYIDSCGIGVLISKFLSVRRRGGDVKLLNLTPRSHHVLQITRLREVFQIFTSEDEALRSF